MALRDYFYDGMDSGSSFASTTYHDGQTFTASDNYTVGNIVLKLYRHAVTNPGNVTCYIYATSGSLPTGSTLATSTVVDCSGITTDSGGEDVTFTFAAGPAITNGTEYAIVILSSNSSPCIYWRVDGSSSTYAGGQAVRAGNPTWYATATIDHWFEVYDSTTVYVEGTKTVTAVAVVSLSEDLMVLAEGIKTVTVATTVSLSTQSHVSQKGFPTDRVSDYDPDVYWDEDTGEWTAARTTHPGNWSQSVVVVSEEGEIYFRTI